MCGDARAKRLHEGKQKNGGEFCAEEIYTETWEWLKQQAITSPFVGMAQNYMKQSNQMWAMLYQIVNRPGSALSGSMGLCAAP